MTLFTELDSEWTRLGASPPAITELGRWAVSDPMVGDFPDLCALVSFAQEIGHPSESDAVLACLARRAAHDSVAARALLQAVLYGLIRIAADFRTGADSDDDAASIVISAAYDRIRTYPITKRPRHIAANILLDARQMASRGLFRRRVHHVLVDDVRPLVQIPSASATTEFLAIVEAAVLANHISKDDARLILLTRVADVPINSIAAAHGSLPQTLRQRRLRAEAALAASALADSVA